MQRRARSGHRQLDRVTRRRAPIAPHPSGPRTAGHCRGTAGAVQYCRQCMYRPCDVETCDSDTLMRPQGAITFSPVTRIYSSGQCTAISNGSNGPLSAVPPSVFIFHSLVTLLEGHFYSSDAIQKLVTLKIQSIGIFYSRFHLVLRLIARVNNS